MALSSTLVAQVVSTLSQGLDLAAATSPLSYTKKLVLTSGTGANQADKLFHDTRTLAASATENLDLAGVLTDAFNALLTFVKVKAIVMAAAAGNTNNVVVGNSGINAFVGPFGAAAHTVAVPPGGVFLIAGPALAGLGTVVAATGDILTVTNSGAGSSVTYDIIIIGTSA